MIAEPESVNNNSGITLWYACTLFIPNLLLPIGPPYQQIKKPLPLIIKLSCFLDLSILIDCVNLV
jgi:hypothetical protein